MVKSDVLLDVENRHGAVDVGVLLGGLANSLRILLVFIVNTLHHDMLILHHHM